jgi:nucleoside-diphosphate-sugar epimerase
MFEIGEDMKALVTGAAGFIGSHLVERLAAAGHDVRGMVRSENQEGRIREWGGEPIHGDVTQPATIRPAMQGVDTVFHVAARVTDWGNWSAFEAATVQGTRNTLQAAADAGVRRFVGVSSVAVYDNRVGDRKHVVTEETPHNGVGDRLLAYYSRSKLLAEDEVWEFHRGGKLEVSVVRPAWVYGPRDRTVLPRLVEFMATPLACWFGKRDPVADPIYVTDVADCTILAGTNPQAVGQAYNVAPPETIRLRRFLGLLLETLGVRPPRWTINDSLILALARIIEGGARWLDFSNPPFLTVGAVATVTTNRHYDPGKAMRELGWRPKVTLEQGVAQTAQWFRTQPDLAGLATKAANF